LFFFFLLFHASMMSDLIVDAHDVARSESHPTSLQLAKQSLDEAPYKLSRAVAKLASITFWSIVFFLLD
jgi:hypothetical protein